MHAYVCMWHCPRCTKIYSVRKFASASVRNFYAYENFCDYSIVHFFLGSTCLWCVYVCLFVCVCMHAHSCVYVHCTCVHACTSVRKCVIPWGLLLVDQTNMFPWTWWKKFTKKTTTRSSASFLVFEIPFSLSFLQISPRHFPNETE